MKLIKHLINIMFLWSIPYILLAFFMLITWFSFSYREVIISGLWNVILFFYCLLTALLYMISLGETDEMSIIKV